MILKSPKPLVEIVSTGRFLPDRVVTNSEFESTIATTDQWIDERTGIKERRQLGDQTDVAGMGISSAGIAMVTSIVSSITGIPVKREIAMTGEVTITGKILPIGGLKEKLLAAHRAGIKKVLIPEDNKKDLTEIPDKIKSDMEIEAVSHVDNVLQIALTKPLKAIDWVDVSLSTSTKEKTIVEKHN